MPESVQGRCCSLDDVYDARRVAETIGIRHYVALKSVLVIDDVVGDADGLCYAARVVYVIERTTAALHGLGHSRMASQTALIPELHREGDEIVYYVAGHGRDGGGIYFIGYG